MGAVDEISAVEGLAGGNGVLGHPGAPTGATRVGVWCVGGFPSSLVESAEIKGGVKCWNLLRLFCQRQRHL